MNNTILFVSLASALVSVTGLRSTAIANAITYKPIDVMDDIHAIIHTNHQVSNVARMMTHIFRQG